MKIIMAKLNWLVVPALLSLIVPAEMAAQNPSGACMAAVPLAADFDGDGRADPALYNTNGNWKFKLSAADYATVPLNGFLGSSEAAALAADFDGDAKADPSVYYAGLELWAIKLSSLNYLAPTIIQRFGGNGWQAVAEDFDGDRKADPSVYNTNGTWKIKLSTAGYTTITETDLLGFAGWTPVAADFDGDGKVDPAIYQSQTGSWIILLSTSDFKVAVIEPLGFLGSLDYVGLAADFDGDAHADPAVAQTSTGNWRIKLSSANYTAVSLENYLGEDITAVALQKVSNLYYRVDINMQAASHYAIGRQYGLLIKNNVANFESEVDDGLNAMFELLQLSDKSITVEKLIARAQTILTNVPSAYQEEILGLQSVFSGTDDTLGNGKLSQNKILLYELVADVMRAESCSASAAFGDATDTGDTIISRHLEWLDITLENQARLHTVTVLHNGSSSIVLFGFLGQMQLTSGFSAGGIFAAILDSNVGLPYATSADKRSYSMDLRYALENRTNLQSVADFFGGKNYAFNFNLLLADAERAAVLECDIHTPFCGLRTAASPLKTDTEEPILPWDFANAIAVVNWFTLPGTIDNSDYWEGNAPRWSSFINLYQQRLDHQGKITMNGMKLIAGYTGPDSDGKAANGAIWRYDDGESVVQSIIMDMKTFETWVSFQPAGQPALQSPNYIQVFSGNPVFSGVPLNSR